MQETLSCNSWHIKQTKKNYTAWGKKKDIKNISTQMSKQNS